ncbi:MAG TPA: lysozyme [Caulobacter sp.]|nr:lysozyme [Caulobacter sp.]
MSKALFDAVRAIVGRGLTQPEVDQINRALMGDLATTAREGMRISQRGIDLIHSFEQLRLTSYPDSGSKNGLPVTCGWGTTRDEDGSPIKLGAVWTKEKADRLFARDIATFEQGVNLLLAGAPTTQAQFDALVSFAYNVGLDIDDDTVAEGLGDSSLLRKHKAGDYAGAQAAFGSWIYNDGKKLNGLIRRRAAEAALYGSAG